MMSVTYVTRRSPFTGQINTLPIPMNEVAFEEAVQRWQAGALLQNAFPNLDAGLREFIKTGITPAEWESLFGEE